MASDFLAQLETLEEQEVVEKCKNFQDKIPGCFESCNSTLQAQIIDIIVQKTLVHMAEHEAENAFKLLLQAGIKACQDAFEALCVWEDVMHVLDHLQGPVQIMDCITMCSQHVQDRGWRSSSLLSVLLQCGFQGLKATYTHCQDSSRVYGAVLDSVNAPLTRLFRTATALQTSLHQLAELLANDENLAEDDLVLLTSVCDDVAETGRLLTSLDARAMAEAWKCYLRLLQLLPDRLPASADLPQALTFMVDQVTDRLADVRRMGATTPTSGNNKQVAKSLKMCSFYLKLIVGLAESYTGEARGAFPALTGLVVTLFRFSAPDEHVTDLDPALLSQLASQLTVAAEPLLFSLLEDQAFPEPFWSTLDSRSHLGPLGRLRCCLALARRCCHLPEAARTAWTAVGDGRRHLVAAVLELLPQCGRELVCAVQLECEGHGRPRTSLYEHALVSVCALVGALTATELRATERHLWRHLCRAGLWGSLLAADVLCFVARYGPAALCRSYCLAAATALGRRRSPTLARLLRRLLPLLAAEHRTRLLCAPPAPAAALLRAGCPAAGAALLPAALRRAGQLAEAAERLTPLELQELADVLAAVEAGSAAELPAAELAGLLGAVERLWAALPDGVAGPAAGRLAAALLTATAVLADRLSEQRIGEILSLARRWLPGCSVPVKLGLIGLLKSTGSRKFRSGQNDSWPTSVLPELYRLLLTDDRRLVRQRALDAFAAFARSTPHAELIAAAVGRPAGLQSRVGAHLRLLAGRPCGAAALSERLRAAGPALWRPAPAAEDAVGEDRRGREDGEEVPPPGGGQEGVETGSCPPGGDVDSAARRPTAAGTRPNGAGAPRATGGRRAAPAGLAGMDLLADMDAEACAPPPDPAVVSDVTDTSAAVSDVTDVSAAVPDVTGGSAAVLDAIGRIEAQLRRLRDGGTPPATGRLLRVLADVEEWLGSV